MNFIKRLREWLGRKEDEVEQTKSEYWKNKWNESIIELEAWQKEYFRSQKACEYFSEEIVNLKQEISELKDEIDVQKAKAAKYLSYYLELLEKHAPND